MATNGEVDKSGPSPLPSAPSVKISESLTIQPPLSRLGRGPGLILVIDKTIPFEAVSESIDPPPLKKWAEEGYVVAQVDAADSNDFAADLKQAIAVIKDLPEYDNNPKFGIISELSLPTSAVHDGGILTVCPQHISQKPTPVYPPQSKQHPRSTQ